MGGAAGESEAEAETQATMKLHVNVCPKCIREISKHPRAGVSFCLRIVLACPTCKKLEPELRHALEQNPLRHVVTRGKRFRWP